MRPLFYLYSMPKSISTKTRTLKKPVVAPKTGTKKNKIFSSIIPCLRYQDAGTAIDWLCDAFGFEKDVVIENKDGSVGHAQLTFNGSMIMLGSVDNKSEWGKFIKQPSEIGNFQTQSPFVIVSDPDTHYKNAKAHGAKIALDIKTEEYGGRGYSCYDPEGHLWNFGSYNPWEKDSK